MSSLSVKLNRPLPPHFVCRLILGLAVVMSGVAHAGRQPDHRWRGHEIDENAPSSGFSGTANAPLPDACTVIFPTEESAKSHCPVGTTPTAAIDFWLKRPLGWACDCPTFP